MSERPKAGVVIGAVLIVGGLLLVGTRHPMLGGPTVLVAWGWMAWQVHRLGRGRSAE